MPALNESTPKHKPGMIGGLDFDHPGGLVIKGGRVQIDGPPTKEGHPTKTWVDGLQIAMYKDQPGEYYALNGRRVSEAIARQAGYDVDRMAKLKHRMSFLTDSASRFDAEHAITATRTVIAEREGVQVVQLGGQDKYVLEDVSDVNAPPYNLTPGRHLNREEALRELAIFFGDDPKPAVIPSAGVKAPEFRKAELGK